MSLKTVLNIFVPSISCEKILNENLETGPWIIKSGPTEYLLMISVFLFQFP